MTLAELAALAALVWIVGMHAHAFTGFPKGFDAPGHLSKVTFVTRYWPHISWNYQWYAGEPTFAGSYPPGYHLLVAALASAAHLKLTTAMNAVTYAAVLATAAGLHWLVRAATGRRAAGLLAATLLLACPTLWSQVLALGLYPRFCALAALSPALAGAVRHARRGGRWPLLGAIIGLAVSLSMHPIVGALGIGFIVLIYTTAGRGSWIARLVAAAAVCASSFALSAYFYLPLALTPRSQSLFTNSEKNLPWQAFLWPTAGNLDGLFPLLLPASAIAVVAGARWIRRPTLPRADKVALGVDVVVLSDPSTSVDRLPSTASTTVRRFVAWRIGHDRDGAALRLLLASAAAVPGFFGYGLIGYLEPHFPLWVNGLQPADLLVYPAYLLCLILGLLTGCLTSRRLARRKPRSLRRRAGGAARVVTSLAMVGACVAATASILPSRVRGHDFTSEQAMAAMVPPQAAGETNYRFGGATDSVTEWVNAYSNVPQLRGYQDHGALHLDWQTWLEESMLQPDVPAAQRNFLLDWYGVKWVMTDATAGPVTQYSNDPADFTKEPSTDPWSPIAVWDLTHPTQISSATTAPVVMVVGDDEHYDLVLRSVARLGLGTNTLIVVRGPSDLDQVNAATLSGVDEVLLYGTSGAKLSRDAEVLKEFVTAGGTLIADAADDNGTLTKLATAPNSPLPVTGTRPQILPAGNWHFAAGANALADGVDFDQFAPPQYGNGGSWFTRVATGLPAWASSVVTSKGQPLVVAGTLGAGHAVYSGMNLPYHADAYITPAEDGFLAKMLTTYLPSHRAAVSAAATFISSEHQRIVAAPGARGVLYKEQDAPDWKVTVDGRTSVVYLAGPGMMWVPLTPSDHGATVDFTYTLSPVEKGSYLISAFALLVMVAAALSGQWWQRPWRRIQHQLFGFADEL